jgi:two-component system, NarL family, nitrate/nitrite response regulator NarL
LDLAIKAMPVPSDLLLGSCLLQNGRVKFHSSGNRKRVVKGAIADSRCLSGALGIVEYHVLQAALSRSWRTLKMTGRVVRQDQKPEFQRSVRILIADEYALFRNGLQKIFESFPNLVVVGQAADGTETIRLVQDLMPDIVLLDLFMKKMDSLRVLRQVRRVRGVRIIILTAKISQRETLNALRFGASAVLLKESSSQQLLECIQFVYAGGETIEPEPVTPVIERRVLVSEAAQPRSYERSQFTRREMDVMAAIVTGCSNKEIAAKLTISQQTVKHHLSSIFYKTGLSSRLELALFLRENKVVSPAAAHSANSSVVSTRGSLTIQ